MVPAESVAVALDVSPEMELLKEIETVPPELTTRLLLSKRLIVAENGKAATTEFDSYGTVDVTIA